MELGRSIGLATGICFGLVIAFILVKMLNKDRKVKTEYDERQLQIRGRSYMFAFYGTIIMEAVMMCLSMGGLLRSLPIEEYNFHAASMFVGLLVLVVHSVWNGAYWGLNNKIKQFYVVFVLLFLLNLMPFIGVIKNGIVIENGYISNFPFMNFFVIILMVVLAIALIARNRLDNMESEDCL